MISRSILLPILISSFAFTSCQQTMKGSGEIITDNRSIDRFESIEIRGAAEVEITNGTRYNVMVKGYENIVPLVESTVKNGKLIVTTVESIKLVNSKITIQITAPSVKSVTLSGAGELVINSFRESKMEIKLQGAGDVRFKDSECDTVFATLSGAGNMYVNAKNYLEATLNGVGNIQYSGDPTVKSKISGMGNISKK